MNITYGGAPVPWTVAWEYEDQYYPGTCPEFNLPAIRQVDEGLPHKGRPRFGEPHNDRQRKCVAKGLCDLCAKPLKNDTKISLSNFLKGVPITTQLRCVEPLLHVDCARTSLQHCPALRRQIREDRVAVRQVFRWRARVIPEQPGSPHILHTIPDYTGVPLIGLGVIELLSWRDVTMDWEPTFID
jgi:hypothetical protein